MPTTKPRLSYRGQAFAAAELHNVNLEIDDTKPGLVGTATTADGFVFTATGEHTIYINFDGKREQAWPKVAKLLKAGVRECTCTVCVPPVPAAPATDVVADLLDKVLAVLTPRQIAGYKRTARPYGPYIDSELRADYHKGWAAGGSSAPAQLAGKTSAYTAGFNDRRKGAEPWTSLTA